MHDKADNLQLKPRLLQHLVKN